MVDYRVLFVFPFILTVINCESFEIKQMYILYYLPFECSPQTSRVRASHSANAVGFARRPGIRCAATRGAKSRWATRSSPRVAYWSGRNIKLKQNPSNFTTKPFFPTTKKTRSRVILHRQFRVSLVCYTNKIFLAANMLARHILCATPRFFNYIREKCMLNLKRRPLKATRK